MDKGRQVKYSEINEARVPEQSKRKVIRYILKKIQDGDWLQVSFIVANLRAKGFDWPELDTIEKSVDIELDPALKGLSKIDEPALYNTVRYSGRGRRIHEARGESKIMYHGTSSTFLPQIMKFGLIPNPSEKVYDEGDWESYYGSYLTTDKKAAESNATKTAEKFQGDEIVVAVQVLMKSTATDEDSLGQLFSDSINAASHYWAPDILKRRPGKPMDHKDQVAHIFKELHELMLKRKITINRKGLQILKDMERFMSTAKFKLHNSIGAGLEELTGAYPELRYMVDILAQNMVYKSSTLRRVLQPIKFKGKTRIIKIWQYGYEGWGDWIEIWPYNEVKDKSDAADAKYLATRYK